MTATAAAAGCVFYDMVTIRIRPLTASAISRSPALSTATPKTWESSAFLAWPPSPENPVCPLPATG